ncbi:hypothetical protein BKL51_00030 [Rodentibacter sp. Ppn85]|nr:hypothetical protein BKL51_00030 [Rodentibacter sp. Ppn85]
MEKPNQRQLIGSSKERYHILTTNDHVMPKQQLTSKNKKASGFLCKHGAIIPFCFPFLKEKFTKR